MKQTIWFILGLMFPGFAIYSKIVVNDKAPEILDYLPLNVHNQV